MLRALLLCLCCFTSLARADAISIAAIDWEPFSGKNLPDGGFAVALCRTLLKNAGYESNVYFVPWTRALKGTESGTYQVNAAVWYAKDRAAYMLYSEPYTVNKLVFVSRSDTPFQYKGLSSLRGKRIGVGQDYAYPQEILHAPDVRFDEAIDDEQNLRKLFSGRIDLTLGDELNLRYEARKLNQRSDVFYFDKTPLDEKPLYITVSKAMPNAEKVLADLNRELAKMKANGSFDALLKQYGF
ncbi:MAG: amino acid ABC transporter substrate-binding protein [Oceanospirillaceae bacterium]|nr:amino acid ABC transporter substrate-binding protein [Oceanospirillaceae bacterium]MCP5350217.1 amino acid ABC transporter substrate-binding protein [Oceanospirillaceae bacterium]